ncbi:MAG: hypothetical protein IPJ52_09465 [Rhodocyclaceae bacterium]|nr:hypothetical protein [Rhodocyclaceae bacterium]
MKRAVDAIHSVIEKWKAGDYSGKAVEFMPVNADVRKAAELAGLDFSGYQHAIDQSAIQHVAKRHGNQKIETSRGQISVTESDYDAIPDALYSPDYMVFGGKNLHGIDVIGYMKIMPNHQLLYLDEVRGKRHQLALDSMRKYPATRNAISVAETLEPTSKNDGGDVFIVVEMATGRKTSLTADEINKGASYPPMLSRAVSPTPTSAKTADDIIGKPAATPRPLMR